MLKTAKAHTCSGENSLKEREGMENSLAFRLIEVFRIDSSWQFHLKMNFLSESIYLYKKLSQNDENINRQKITKKRMLINGNFLRPITTKRNSTRDKMKSTKFLLIFRIIENRFLTYCSIEKLFKGATTYLLYVVLN